LAEELAELFPERPANAHKGSVGRVLVAGGYATYTGAPALAALGAYRAGAGLVFVAYPEGAAVHPPLEAVRIPVSGWKGEALALAKVEAAAVGMGGGPRGKESGTGRRGTSSAGWASSPPRWRTPSPRRGRRSLRAGCARPGGSSRQRADKGGKIRARPASVARSWALLRPEQKGWDPVQEEEKVP